MAMRNTEQRRSIHKINHLVELDRISSASERWFVEEPFQDISACLVLEETNGQTVWWGCAALVPSDAPYNTCEGRPELCSALGMVTDSLAKAVLDLAFSELCQLSERSWREPLFSAGTGSVWEVVNSAIAAQEIPVYDGNIKAQDLAVWAQKQLEAPLWYPLVLTKCPLSLYNEERWMLVQRWEVWKRDGTSLKAQCKEYNLEFGADKTLAAFRMHLRYQGLPASDKELGRKKRPRWRKAAKKQVSNVLGDTKPSLLEMVSRAAKTASAKST